MFVTIKEGVLLNTSNVTFAKEYEMHNKTKYVEIYLVGGTKSSVIFKGSMEEFVELMTPEPVEFINI